MQPSPSRPQGRPQLAWLPAVLDLQVPTDVFDAVPEVQCKGQEADCGVCARGTAVTTGPGASPDAGVCATNLAAGGSCRSRKTWR